MHVQDEDGAELVFPRVLDELQKNAKGDRWVEELKVDEREIDDDLPRILEKWQAFLSGEDL
ncbi:hypothetical protein QUF70_06205 [Desulfobacterales bacterium HSG17]|nr:hypothetical protein [Desulfobacterales bacterium HSG17]